jgi:hypothetical protein
VSGGPPVPRIERERERERKRLLLSFACVRGQLRESNGAQPAIMSAQQGILVEQQCCGDRREKHVRGRRCAIMLLCFAVSGSDVRGRQEASWQLPGWREKAGADASAYSYARMERRLGSIARFPAAVSFSP